MNILAAFIDYHVANLETREEFSLKTSEIEGIGKKMLEDRGIKGVVMVNTCNRFEIYLSLKEDYFINPFEKLCCITGRDFGMHNKFIRILTGIDAIRHLFIVASGADSKLFGDSQIISQVNLSLKFSIDNKLSDNFLNVVFRNAITSAKKIKTELDFSIFETSTADRAVDILKSTDIKKVLVIGNGMIAREVIKKLIKSGYEVCMTLREYRHREVVIPKGVRTVSYHGRYFEMELSDAVISATSSPHYTVTIEEVKKLNKIPEIMIDMAVPRDIEPEIGEFTNLLNIDDISLGGEKVQRKEIINSMEEYFERYIDNIKKWNDFRANMQRKIFIIKEGDFSEKVQSIFEISDRIIGERDLIKDIPNANFYKEDKDFISLAKLYANRGKIVSLISREPEVDIENFKDFKGEVEIIE